MQLRNITYARKSLRKLVARRPEANGLAGADQQSPTGVIQQAAGTQKRSRPKRRMSSTAKSNIKTVEPSAHGLKKYCFFASDADFQLAEHICVFLGEQRSPILRDAMRRGLVVLDKLDAVEDTPGQVSRTALYLSQVQVAHADAIGQRMGLYRALILRAAMHHGLKAIHAELVKDFGFTHW